MMIGVVGNDVTLITYSPDDLRVFCRFFTDTEENGMQAVFGENI